MEVLCLEEKVIELIEEVDDEVEELQEVIVDLLSKKKKKKKKKKKGWISFKYVLICIDFRVISLVIL